MIQNRVRTPVFVLKLLAFGTKQPESRKSHFILRILSKCELTITERKEPKCGFILHFGSFEIDGYIDRYTDAHHSHSTI